MSTKEKYKCMLCRKKIKTENGVCPACIERIKKERSEAEQKKIEATEALTISDLDRCPIQAVTFACKECGKNTVVESVRCPECTGSTDKGPRLAVFLPGDKYKATVEELSQSEAIKCDVCQTQIQQGARYLLLTDYWGSVGEVVVPPAICKRCVTRAYFEIWK